MASKDRETKVQQFDVAKKEFDAFATTLKEKGLTDKQSLKNSVYRNLKANVTTARNRIKAIDAAKAHVEAIKQKDVKASATKNNPKKKKK